MKYLKNMKRTKLILSINIFICILITTFIFYISYQIGNNISLLSYPYTEKDLKIILLIGTIIECIVFNYLIRIDFNIIKNFYRQFCNYKTYKFKYLLHKRKFNKLKCGNIVKIRFKDEVSEILYKIMIKDDKNLSVKLISENNDVITINNIDNLFI